MGLCPVISSSVSAPPRHWHSHPVLQYKFMEQEEMHAPSDAY